MPRGGDRRAAALANGNKVGRPKKPKQALITEALANELLKKRLRQWNIGPTDFLNQLELQQGRCAVCAELLTQNWVIDHDHMTMRVRGLIHTGCNMLLGCAKDDPARLERAAAYLRKHNKFLL